MEDFFFKFGAILISLVGVAISTLIALYLKRIPEEMEGAVKRLSREIGKVDDRVNEINDSVVFNDVFLQFGKTQDARHETTDKMFYALEKQMQITVSNNAQEHKSICDKLEKIFDLLINGKQ